jgi:CRP/FNR family transcriptional regulator, cyclic AMP receptor protein
MPQATPTRAPARPSTSARAGGVRLLELDPELAEGLTGDELEAATRHLVVPRIVASGGYWVPPAGLATALGLLVADGFVTRDGSAFGRPDLRLYGAGDVIDARSLADGVWRVLCPATLAVLDARVLLAGRRWPQLLAGLTRRLLDGQAEQHGYTAIASIPRVEDRLLALLTRLGERWGCVTLAGLALELPVTHEVLGRFIGARRPTISLAIAELTEAGRLRRLADGRWLLPAAPEATA